MIVADVGISVGSSVGSYVGTSVGSNSIVKVSKSIC